ncbi:MAG: hypothetical protein JNL74_06130 [Fibrobacteres bacterium]|nr:hypothetical protein [Fibrobacterota bacterium]
MNKTRTAIITALIIILLVAVIIYRMNKKGAADAPSLPPAIPSATETLPIKDTVTSDSNKTIQQTEEQVKDKTDTDSAHTKTKKKESSKDTARIDTASQKQTEEKKVFTEDDADELDRILENAAKASKASAKRADAIQDLEEQIVTEEERVVVKTWQQTTIEKQEQKKNSDWAGFHKSIESRITGLWQMGDSGAIAFYKDGTGQVSFIRDDAREQTLTGNFFFRYSIDGGLVQIIPILTKSSNRRITANYVIKVDGNKLIVGPYTYQSLGKRK